MPICAATALNGIDWRRAGARMHLFVATLGYSRRLFVRAFRHERQPA
jgi:transposase